MAEIYVRHSLNSSKAVKFNFTFKQFTLKNERGDSKWILEVGTTYPAADGGKVPVKVVHNINESTLEDEIEKAISELCAYIDWSEFAEDKWPPELAGVHPSGSNTPIKTLIERYKLIRHPDRIRSSDIIEGVFDKISYY